ncbi:glycoside hydrolase family 3 protein [Fodinibius sp.]|uniref:glycoside hydrolase family 3 protein n=1 Tax=Fodinibius sp. TaxID=1872440 RepID=UPI002ACDA9B7|nr:glycoside hydrolase family 3 N-terminal domain-containing protein [Fodinibius sp.]MDZ7658378.1 glycoside hydrolase family 3 N-terminal domain-containing protein [Fodinibius sp.]
MFRLLLISLLSLLITNPSFSQTLSAEKDVSLDEKIGQMLLAGFRGTTLADTNHIVRDIKKYHLGGIILFDYDVPSKSSERNIQSPRQLKRLISDLKQLSDIPLIISIDQEGGKVARLKSSMGFPEIKSAEYLGQVDNIDSTRFYAQKMGQTLANLGINMNFAPVVDLNTNPDNPVIGGLERSFSADPQTVVQHASIYIKTLNKHGIWSVLKHFPGHGSSKKDSHLGVVDVTETWSKKELIPYRKLINRDLGDAIMTAHIFNRNIDPDYPATLSKPTITGLLRNELNYNGVVISDDLMMGAIRNEYGLKTTIKKAVNAGVDILVFANNSIYDPDIVPKAHKIIKELLDAGEINRNQIERSYNRIMELKRQDE